MSIKKPVHKIEKLIDELCPDGVEFRALGEVCLSINAGGDLLRICGLHPFSGTS
jgi:hypothetical protein